MLGRKNGKSTLDLLYTQELLILELHKKLTKAEHDRDRYKARVDELQKIIKNGGNNNDR